MNPAINEQFSALSVSCTLAAHLVGEEPSAEWMNLCMSERLFDEAPFGEDDAYVQTGLNMMSSWFDQVTEDTFAERLGDIQRDHLRLLVGVGEPEAPAWESYWTQPSSPLMTRVTLDVRKYYKAYGLEAREGIIEQSDSLRLMLEFLGIAFQMAAEADEGGFEQHVEHRLRDIEKILVEHMLPWMCAWRWKMNQHAYTLYFRGVGNYIFGLLKSMARYFDVAYNADGNCFMRSSTTLDPIDPNDAYVETRTEKKPSAPAADETGAVANAEENQPVVEQVLSPEELARQEAERAAALAEQKAALDALGSNIDKEAMVARLAGVKKVDRSKIGMLR